MHASFSTSTFFNFKKQQNRQFIILLSTIQLTLRTGGRDEWLPATSVNNKKLSYCWETVRRESMPRIAEMDVEMTT